MFIRSPERTAGRIAEIRFSTGMKAVLNGVSNLSILDGWWIEGFNGKSGWAFNHEEGNGPGDHMEPESIYPLLEVEVLPLYDKISENGVPLLSDPFLDLRAGFSRDSFLRPFKSVLHISPLRM